MVNGRCKLKYFLVSILNYFIGNMVHFQSVIWNSKRLFSFLVCSKHYLNVIYLIYFKSSKEKRKQFLSFWLQEHVENRTGNKILKKIKSTFFWLSTTLQGIFIQSKLFRSHQIGPRPHFGTTPKFRLVCEKPLFSNCDSWSRTLWRKSDIV